MNHAASMIARIRPRHHSLVNCSKLAISLAPLLSLLACSSSPAPNSSNANGGTSNASGASAAGAGSLAGSGDSSAGNGGVSNPEGGGPTAGSAGAATAGSAGAATAGGAGAGNPGGAGGQGGSGGGSGSAGSSGQGGASGSASGGAAGLGGASLCDGSKYAICESFENTAVGSAPPNGWTIAGSNYGPGSIAIVEDQAARGKHSMKVTLPNGAGSTEKFLQKGSLGALANGHFGRVFYRIQDPTTTAFVHWDLIVGVGDFNGANRRVRWGVTGTGVGSNSANWSWIYNIEQSDSGTEDRTAHPQLSEWQCLEWRWAGGSAQQMRFYLDGKESTQFHVDGKLPGGASADLPIFSSLNFGISSFHALNMPLVIWIDEIAVDADRIGCGN
jgi:hypothetical protein